MRLREPLAAAFFASILTAVSIRWMPLVVAVPVSVTLALGAALLAGLAGRRRLSRESEPQESYSKARTPEGAVPLATISHEIRTPLNGILGLTQLLMRMQPTTQQREYLEAIKSSGRTLLRLINDLLDYSKMGAGTLRLTHELFPLRKCVRDTVRGLAPQAHLSGLELAYLVEPDVPDDLFGDPSRLRQVLTNLLENAIKFTRKGDVFLEVSLVHSGPRRPTSPIGGQTARVRFSVSDTGIGVPQEQRRDIFQAFAQGVSIPTTSLSEGVGLGLAIAKDLVERMDGEIGFDPLPGGGTRFYFTVELQLADGGATPEDVSPTDAADFSVLVVDDSAAQRIALTKQMSSWGFDVVAAEDSTTALEAIHLHGPFSLLVIDSSIPGVDIWALARELQSFASTPGVLMTLAHEHIDTEVLRAHGFVGQLTKPAAPTHLLRAIEIIRRGATVDAPDDVQTHSMDRLAIGGLRVIVAEDNPVNRTVVVQMLERAGSDVCAVEDGRAALELLERERFDICLVDVQMPNLDGLGLARAIRAREARTGEHLPLVAVTAHATDAEREGCLAAGMDGFLSKPFQEEELVSEMRRCLKSLGDTRAGSAEPCFDRATALARANGDVELLAELAALFLDETPPTLDAIRAALVVSDGSGVERLAHRLKGSLLTLAAVPASNLAHELETTARTSTTAECEAVLQRLESALAQLSPELEALAASVRAR